jgi:hypothetical protein
VGSATLRLTFLTLFQSKAYTLPDTAFTISCTNLQNPRTLLASTSFQIDVSDASQCPVASIKTGLIVNMQTLPSFTAIGVASDNAFNGVISGYTVEVTPSIEMITGDYMFITFPPEVSVTTPTCSAVLILGSTSSCTLVSANRVRVGLVFKISPNPIGTKFSFKISNVKNAMSTKPTSPFSGIEAQDSLFNQIAVYTATGPTVKNTSPSAVNPLTITIDQFSKDVAVATDYTFTYTTVNDMPSGSSFLLNYAAQPVTPAATGSFRTCQVTFNLVVY